MESFVAVMAMCAAAVLDPGIYFAINAPLATLGGTAQAAAETIRGWGFTVTPEAIEQLARVGRRERRCWDAPAGRRRSRSAWPHPVQRRVRRSTCMALWYHFAIMFEALFILTTHRRRHPRRALHAAGAGRPRLGPAGPDVVVSQHAFWPRRWWPLAWGYFLVQGVLDPLGGINSLWPLFGISNQLLAAVALCVGTTLIIKCGKARYAWVTLVPLAWLLTVTLTASWQKIFSPDPRLGFLADARALELEIANGTMEAARGARLIFNDQLDAVVAGTFVVIVLAVVISSAREWIRILWGGREPVDGRGPDRGVGVCRLTGGRATTSGDRREATGDRFCHCEAP